MPQATNCEICEARVLGDGIGHYTRHLVTARQVIEEARKLNLGADRSATAREWVKVCTKKLGRVKAAAV